MTSDDIDIFSHMDTRMKPTTALAVRAPLHPVVAFLRSVLRIVVRRAGLC